MGVRLPPVALHRATLVRLTTAALLAAACGTDPIGPGAEPRLITVRPAPLRLSVGSTQQLQVTVTDTAGVPIPDAVLTFTSLDHAIATVSATGRVAAVGPGHTTVLVESAGSAATVELATGLAFTDVTAGSHHTCALTATHALYCWGANAHGQLGVGDQMDRLLPTRVEGTWTAVAAGDEHTCGLRTGGFAACWGRGTDGRLGTGGPGSATSPQPVAGGLVFRTISAGGRHTCAIAADSSTWCWGANEAGQVGLSFATRYGPTGVANGLLAVQISAGAAHTCAVQSGGATWCWGANAEGQLAVDSVITLPQPAPRLAAAGRLFAMVRTGGTGFTCGLATDAAAWCWGRGLEHQLGLGATVAAQVRPVVLRSTAGDTLRFQSLAAGWGHACGITPDGTLYCWGTSRLGQPGLYVAPRPLAVLAGVARVSAGFTHTCALMAAGRLVCWGGGQAGALGTGATTSSDLPLQVALQLGDAPG